MPRLSAGYTRVRPSTLCAKIEFNLDTVAPLWPLGNDSADIDLASTQLPKDD